MIALIATGYLYPAVAIRYGSGLIIRSGGHTFSILAESLAVRLNCIPVIMMFKHDPDLMLFPFERFDRVVYHLHHMDELDKIHRVGGEIVRVVFVVDDNMTEDRNQ